MAADLDMRAGESVYADGFGRWHAVVVDSPRGLTRAMLLMATALWERGTRRDTLAAMLEYVNRDAVSVPDAPAGFVHFAEYALDL